MNLTVADLLMAREADAAPEPEPAAPAFDISPILEQLVRINAALGSIKKLPRAVAT